MHVVLLILKIIGAILGILLGLLLLLLLLVLFVPVKYQINLIIKGKVDVDSYVSWLWHMVYVSIQYHDNKMNYCLRIFGIPVRKNKEQKEETKREPEVKRKAEISELKQKQPSIEQDNKKQGSKKPDSKKQDRITKDETKETVTEKNESKPGNRNETEDRKIKQVGNETSENETSGKRVNFHPIQNVKNFIAKIKNLIQKLKEKIENIPRTWYKIKRTISNLNQKKKRIVAYIKDEGTKNSIRKIKRRLFEILRYVGPRKLTGYIQFGTGDPCSTGKLLGIVCIAQAYLKSKVQIKPDFDDKTIEACLTAKGRMRVIRFLRVGGSLYFDKEIKKFIEDGKQLKEELNG